MSNNLKIENRTINLTKIRTFFILFALIAIIPTFFHSQWITWPYVNALLLITCVLVWPMEAVIIWLVPSAVALASWLLPAPLAPIIPFIMISNAIYIAVFNYLHKKHFAIAISVAAIAKFIFLQIVIVFIASTLVNNIIMQKLIIMLSWPQLATAILGWLLAFWILKVLNKND